MICRLCGEDKKLIKAHVIPEWVFRYLYPEQDRKRKSALLLIGQSGRPKRRPIGPYDSNILCKDCDQKLGSLDSYGKEIFLDSELRQHPRNELLSYIEPVNHFKIKQFLVSVLWRSGVSNQEEFRRVNLGPYEARIRDFLLTSTTNTDKPDIYSVLIARYDIGKLPSDVVERNVQIPHVQRIDGINIGVIYLPRGLKVYIKVDQRPLTDPLSKVVLGVTNEMLILRLGNYEKSEEFKALMRVPIPENI